MGRTRPVVHDGQHRYAAAIIADATHLTLEITYPEDVRDVIEWACSAPGPSGYAHRLVRAEFPASVALGSSIQASRGGPAASRRRAASTVSRTQQARPGEPAVTRMRQAGPARQLPAALPRQVSAGGIANSGKFVQQTRQSVQEVGDEAAGQDLSANTAARPNPRPPGAATTGGERCGWLLPLRKEHCYMSAPHAVTHERFDEENEDRFELAGHAGYATAIPTRVTGCGSSNSAWTRTVAATGARRRCSKRSSPTTRAACSLCRLSRSRSPSTNRRDRPQTTWPPGTPGTASSVTAATA